MADVWGGVRGVCGDLEDPGGQEELHTNEPHARVVFGFLRSSSRWVGLVNTYGLAWHWPLSIFVKRFSATARWVDDVKCDSLGFSEGFRWWKVNLSMFLVGLL